LVNVSGSIGLLTETDIKPKHPDNVPRKPQVLAQRDTTGVLVNGSAMSRVLICDMTVFRQRTTRVQPLACGGNGNLYIGP